MICHPLLSLEHYHCNLNRKLTTATIHYLTTPMKFKCSCTTQMTDPMTPIVCVRQKLTQLELRNFFLRRITSGPFCCWKYWTAWMRPIMRSNLSLNGLAMLTLTGTHSIRMEDNWASIILMYCSNLSPMHSACYCQSSLWQFRMVHLAMLLLMSLHRNYSIWCKIQLLWRMKTCWLTYKIH